MSISQDSVFSDEEKYENDSFETDVTDAAEPSDADCKADEVSGVLTPKSSKYDCVVLKTSPRNDFWTCESSSDDDDVVIGNTVADINTDSRDFSDDDLSLTPAARVFQMASQRKSAGKVVSSDDNYDEDDEDEDEDEDIDNDGDGDEDEIELEDCEDVDDEIEEIHDIEKNENDQMSAKKNYHVRSKLVYDQYDIYATSGIGMTEVYSDAGDEGEIETEESNLYQELCEEDEETDDELRQFIENEQKINYEESLTACMEESKNNEKKYNEEKKDHDENEYSATGSDNNDLDNQDDDDEKTIGPSSEVASICSEKETDVQYNRKSETKILRVNDSIEEFKRKVVQSQRMRCISDGGGDRAPPKTRKSGIPVRIGHERIQNFSATLRSSGSKTSIRANKSVADMRTHVSLPDFSDAEIFRNKQRNQLQKLPQRQKHYLLEDENLKNDLLKGAHGYGDGFAYSDYDYLTEDFKPDFDAMADGKSTYSMHLDAFMEPRISTKKPKKLKAGERRNKSFSNERLRDIERHNNILLNKILNQKPTYIIDEKKKKKDKFAGLPPTTRVTSAEINRKKQQRQIDMDNQNLKRKLEAIAKRKPGKQIT